MGINTTIGHFSNLKLTWCHSNVLLPKQFCYNQWLMSKAFTISNISANISISSVMSDSHSLWHPLSLQIMPSFSKHAIVCCPQCLISLNKVLHQLTDCLFSSLSRDSELIGIPSSTMCPHPWGTCGGLLMTITSCHAFSQALLFWNQHLEQKPFLWVVVRSQSPGIF